MSSFFSFLFFILFIFSSIYSYLKLPFFVKNVSNFICDMFSSSYNPRYWKLRGHSSAGRALRWQRRGQGFDPPWLHQNRSNLEQNIDKLFSMNFIGTWLITLFLIAVVIFASYKIFNIMFKSEIYFKKSAISYFLVFVFIFGFLIYFYS